MGPIAILSSTNNDQTAAGQQQQQQGVAARLAAESGSEKAGEIILDALVHKIADMLQIPASEVDPSRPMYRYGVDSLVALEVRNWIMRELNTTLTLFFVEKAGIDTSRAIWGRKLGNSRRTAWICYVYSWSHCIMGQPDGR